MTKLSVGRAEDLAATVLLASNKDILLVPAMNVRIGCINNENNKKHYKIMVTCLLDLKKEKWPGEYGEAKCQSTTNLCLFKKLF